VVLVAVSGVASAERLPIRTYSAADGLPHDEINKIVRDSHGFLWFCTGDGLARFDGYGFTNFTADQGLPPRGTNDLLETRDGHYWVATDGGLFRFDPGGAPARWGATPGGVAPMFVPVTPATDHPRARITTALLEDSRSGIWVGTNDGLYRLDDANRPVLIPIDIGLPADYAETRLVTDIVQDRRGVLWIGTPAGLYARQPDGSARRYTRRDGLPDEYVHDLLEDREGRLWVATRGGGFFALRQDGRGQLSMRPAYLHASGLPSDWIFQLFESADGHIWAATNAGVVEVVESGETRTIRTYTTDQGLSYYEITAVNEDSAGNIWLGTNTVGVMKIARNGFITYGSAEDVAGINGLFEDDRGVICFRGSPPPDRSLPGPTDSRTRFGCLANGRAEWFYPALLTSPGWVVEHVTLHSRTGEWWIGTADGIYRIAGGRDFPGISSSRVIAHYTERDGLPGRQIFRMFEDSRGDVWVSTISSVSSGLTRWERATGRWTSVADLPDFPALRDELARSFAEDGRGAIWIGFNSALVRVTPAGVKSFGAPDGLPPGAIVEMIADHTGQIWFASSQSGLIRINHAGDANLRFKTYTTLDGLSSNAAQVLVEDLAGRIYVGTGRALDRLDPVTARIKHYTTADGLAPGLFRTAYRDREGTLWFGMTGGLSKLVPVADPPGVPPPVIVTGLIVGGERQAVSPLGETALTLPNLQPSQAQVQIDFAGLEFAPGETLRYRFRLDPQTGWSQPVDQRSVNYAGLRPGSYRFLVQAVTSSGLESTQPAAVTFVVLRPIWQRWWFVSGAGLFLAGIVLGVHRYRMKRLLDLADLRTRIALDLHDDIGANLTRIAILSEVARQRSPAETSPDDPVGAISRISRESVAAMSDIVWAINPQRDHLVDLVRRMRHHLEETSRAHGITVQFDAPGADEDMRLDSGLRRDLFLIFKEALNNASRHARSSHVSVALHVDRATLALEITDDGDGFEPSPSREGQGLLSMRHRAERLGGTFQVQSGRGSGTIIRVHAPLAGVIASRRSVTRV
jgi:ligand-binding sensor domain-containing protein/two-component sensor histidine kinase